MAELTFLLVAVGLGIGTAALAKRYNRDAAGWGVFGALLFVIALPLLLLKGPREPKLPVVARHPGAEPHLAENLVASPDGVHVIGVLVDVGHADFDTLVETAGLDEEAVGDIIDALLDRGELDVWDSGFQLTEEAHERYSQIARATRASSPSSRGDDAQADRLRRLAALHADGLLTDEEFASKRESIIHEL